MDRGVMFYLERERSKMKKPDYIHLKKRHPLLLRLAGEYCVKYVDRDQIEQACTLDGDLYNLLVQAYPDGLDHNAIAENRMPDGRRLAKWIHQQMGDKVVMCTHCGYKMSPSGEIRSYLENSSSKCKDCKSVGKIDVLQRFMHQVRANLDIKFELTCRYKDLLRMADSKHYYSCFENWRGVQILRYLASPDACLVVVRDSKGDFSSRALVRLMKRTTGEIVLGINRMYGNGLTVKHVAHALKDKIKVFDLDNKYTFDPHGEALVEYSPPHVIVLKKKPVWEDSSHHKNSATGKIEFTGSEVKT